MEKLTLILALSILILSCSKQKSNSSDSGSDSTETPTISKCTTSTSYTNGVTISGTAKFYKRGLSLTQSSGYVRSISLTSPIATPIAIKYAEIRVLNSNSDIVQCGTTNSSGELKALDGTSTLTLPSTAGTYTIQVLSRSFFTLTSSKTTAPIFDVAIKKDIYDNEIYKISTTITSSGFSTTPTFTGVELLAEANENTSSEIEGGAFNIFNDWITVVEYLNNTSNTGSYDISCLNTSLDIYWKEGFNPAQYVYPDYDPSELSGLSFYLKEDQELYINGGSQGDVTAIDTDHFDDTVIFHEIGHHIENICGTMDSPGGQHTATNRIDPRLAWSEGFGNYIGAHMMKNNLSSVNSTISSSLPTAGEWLHYFDTEGYGNGSSGTLILFRLNRLGNYSSESTAAKTDTIDSVNSSSYPGEGHFREGAIARALFKSSNTCAENCTSSSSASIPFSLMWRSLSTSEGMGQTSKPFKSSDKFFDLYKQLNGGTMNSSVLTMLTSDEAMQPLGHSDYAVTVSSVSTKAWSGYGAVLTTGSSCNLSLQPRPMTFTLSNDESDQRYTNQFFTINKTTSAFSSITITYSSGCNDVDLIVFGDNYNYNEDCSTYSSSTGLCTSRSKTTSDSVLASARTSGTTTETVSISSLTSGEKYLLNVRAYSSNPGTTNSNGVFNSSSVCTYTLTNQDGAQLCPATSY